MQLIDERIFRLPCKKKTGVVSFGFLFLISFRIQITNPNFIYLIINIRPLI